MKRNEIISIDGSEGEGGGQILRTSLALSLLSGQPFRITNIRAKRKKPGLLRQHLTAVTAAVEIGDAAVDGAEIGSRELVFRPGTIKPGEYHFAIGTAGSTSLVLQTILPALALASAPSRVVLEGGTHNPFAPPFDFLARTFLPVLERFGAKVEATLVRPGFFPGGGGRIEVAITPTAQFRAIDLTERGADAGRRAVARFAGLPASIAERAFARLGEMMGYPREICEVVEHSGCGQGFVFHLEARYENVVEVFTGFGEHGVPAEKIVERVVNDARHYLAADAPVGEYLADQLLIPLALAGSGQFRTVGISRHARTNLEVIEKFLPVRFVTEASDRSGVILSVR
jgi:RNA 3'-terminal phosphate cyclase (ATP)